MAYNSALMAISRDQAPRDWSATQDALGKRAEKMGDGNGRAATDRLEAAVARLSEGAGKFGPETQYPLEWAATQIDLGYALLRLGGTRERNPRLGSACQGLYRCAGVISPRKRAPQDGATAENNLRQTTPT